MASHFEDRPQDRHAMDVFFAMPLMFGDAALSYANELSHRWWRHFFRCSHHHPEGHHQLEIPDPLEADDERDLFA